MRYAKDWETSKKRIEAFWNNEIIDRCCIAVQVLSKDFTLTLPDYNNQDDVISFRSDGERLINRERSKFEHTYYAGDAFPQVFFSLGPTSQAGFFKNANYQFKESVWHFPSMTDINDELIFDENSFFYKRIMETAKYLATEAKGEFFISQPDTSGNLDALAALRGTQELLADMMIEPEAVHKNLAILDKVWHKVNQEVFDILKDNNEGGSTIGWLNTWAPNKLSQIQSDISVMFSTETFEEFVVPELNSELTWANTALYHFDGVEQISHLELILSIDKINCIQWNQVDSQPSILNYMDELKKIQAAGKGIYIQSRAPKEIPILLENLSSKGLFIETRLESIEEADELVKLAEKLTRE